MACTGKRSILVHTSQPFREFSYHSSVTNRIMGTLYWWGVLKNHESRHTSGRHPFEELLCNVQQSAPYLHDACLSTCATMETTSTEQVAKATILQRFACFSDWKLVSCAELWSMYCDNTEWESKRNTNLATERIKSENTPTLKWNLSTISRSYTFIQNDKTNLLHSH